MKFLFCFLIFSFITHFAFSQTGGVILSPHEPKPWLDSLRALVKDSSSMEGKAQLIINAYHSRTNGIKALDTIMDIDGDEYPDIVIENPQNGWDSMFLYEIYLYNPDSAKYLHCNALSGWFNLEFYPYQKRAFRYRFYYPDPEAGYTYGFATEFTWTGTKLERAEAYEVMYDEDYEGYYEATWKRKGKKDKTIYRKYQGKIWIPGKFRKHGHKPVIHRNR